MTAIQQRYWRLSRYKYTTWNWGIVRYPDRLAVDLGRYRFVWWKHDARPL